MLGGKTIIVGLGNPILGDDGVGWRVAQEVAKQLAGSQGGTAVEVDRLAVGGLSLMERLVGYERAILVDAIQTGKVPPGSVSCFSLEALPNRAAGHLASAHDTTLQDAMRLGRLMGARLPEEMTVVAVEATVVEAGSVNDFSEELSPEVEAAVPVAVQKIIELI